MTIENRRFLTVLSSVLVCGLAQAEIMDRPQGVKIGQRLTLRPYVAFDFTYDSNQDQQSSNEGNTSWYVNPHLDFTYKADRFNADLGLFYGYRAYNDYQRAQNSHDYGENLKLSWSSADRGQKGWNILLSERFQRVSEDDNLQVDTGRGLWRQRQELDAELAIERRFTEKLHANINGSYYWLDYDNDATSYMNLYGWQRYVGGIELGYALSRWTDFIIDANYQGYVQDNNKDLSGYSETYGTQNLYSRNSDGYSVQGGLQSYLTDKITYRLLVGWSRFNYSDGYAASDGFTYSASANWRISETWSTMLLAQSYYQPSEREYGSANRVDSVSWGLAHTMIRGKLHSTLDLAYRRETREYTDASSWDYDEDIISARLGFDYTLNRFLAIYLRGEYQMCLFDGDMGGIDRDYDRFRVSIGFRLQY